MARLPQTSKKRTPRATLDERRRAFGQALGAAMSNAAMTQWDLAEKLGVGQATVSAWVTGRSTTDDPMAVFDIERALGLGPGNLSRFLGYLPLDAVAVAASFDEVIEADPFLDKDTRELLRRTYDQLKASARRPGRPSAR